MPGPLKTTQPNRVSRRPFSVLRRAVEKVKYGRYEADENGRYGWQYSPERRAWRVAENKLTQRLVSKRGLSWHASEVLGYIQDNHYNQKTKGYGRISDVWGGVSVGKNQQANFARNIAPLYNPKEVKLNAHPFEIFDKIDPKQLEKFVLWHANRHKHTEVIIAGTMYNSDKKPVLGTPGIEFEMEHKMKLKSAKRIDPKKLTAEILEAYRKNRAQ